MSLPSWDVLFGLPYEGEDVRWNWATVQMVNPLRIRFDGEEYVLPFEPESLIAQEQMQVGDRVWCQLIGKRVIIHGKGEPATPVQHLPFSGMDFGVTPNLVPDANARVSVPHNLGVNPTAVLALVHDSSSQQYVRHEPTQSDASQITFRVFRIGNGDPAPGNGVVFNWLALV